MHKERLREEIAGAIHGLFHLSLHETGAFVAGLKSVIAQGRESGGDKS